MVHQEYKPHGDAAGEHHTRNIFSRDQTNVFQREGRNATNKTVKIAETRAPGYGVSFSHFLKIKTCLSAQCSMFFIFFLMLAF